jgi:hypothetical protein
MHPFDVGEQATKSIESLSGLISPDVFAPPVAIHGAGGVVETALAVEAVVRSARQAAGTTTREQQRLGLLQAQDRMDRAFLSEDQFAPSADNNKPDGLSGAAQDYWSRQKAMANMLQALQNLAEQVIDVFRHAILACPLLARCGSSEAEIEALFQLVQMGKLATTQQVLGNVVDGV